MGNYVIAVGNYVIVSPSELGNYKIVDISTPLGLFLLTDPDIGTGAYGPSTEIRTRANISL
jgi:hypothetical protein